MIGDGGAGAVRSGRIDFGRINRAALASAGAVVRGLLPEGRMEGHEYVARNPLRPDKRLGSFKVNISTGRWADCTHSVRAARAIDPTGCDEWR